MKKSELKQIIKEEISKALSEIDNSPADRWKMGSFREKLRMLDLRHVADAYEMAKKYENESWETVKRELKIED